MQPKFNFDDAYEELIEHQNKLAEAKDNKTQAVIDELIDTSFGGSNEAQMKAVQLLKGLALSDDPAANAFMKKLDTFTSGMKSEKAEESVLDESIKSDLDALAPKSLKRAGKSLTLTWEPNTDENSIGEWKTILHDQVKAKLKSNMDKIKHIGASAKGNKIVVEIDMK